VNDIENKSSLKMAHVLISGRVQGVFFRVSTKEVANNLNLSGWIKNTSTGEVDAYFVGSEKNIKTILTWCHKGPEHAKVEAVKNIPITQTEKTVLYDIYQSNKINIETPSSFEIKRTL
jgi:acylphosphatase